VNEHIPFDATEFVESELQQVADAFKRIGVLPDKTHYHLHWTQPEMGPKLLTNVMILPNDQSQPPQFWMRDTKGAFIPVTSGPTVCGDYGHGHVGAIH
jgi:hypothetical protein